MIAAKSFTIGQHSHMGSDYIIDGNNVTIGDHFYHSRGLRVGGGGKNGPNANLTIGDRCTMHNNFINVCEPVVIGNDVGLSHEVTILTHGYWQSVLQGYPAKFAGVTIGNGVIIGYRSLILPGVTIEDGCVIGAGSVVTKSLKAKGVYAGNPAKFIRSIIPLSINEQEARLNQILWNYDYNVGIDFPWVTIDEFTINVLTFEYSGYETQKTDQFRDYLRHYGIRIYTERPFG